MKKKSHQKALLYLVFMVKGYCPLFSMLENLVFVCIELRLPYLLRWRNTNGGVLKR
jgi:hypothetical protein